MDLSAQRKLYMDCIAKQLAEVDMLSSIYCAPGEMHIFDPGVISDFNEFLQSATDGGTTSDSVLKARLDYTITVSALLDKKTEKLEVRIELPHLYPALENAIVSIHSALLGRTKESYLRAEIEKFISALDHNETYIFQLVNWLENDIEAILQRHDSDCENTKINSANTTINDETLEDFERLWIYSHHLKSRTKRQEIIRLGRELDLSGFSRPGKPGIICVEGLLVNTQKFWRIVKTMHWQRIVIRKSEIKRLKSPTDGSRFRRFEGFKEQLFCDDIENEEESSIMDMGLFIKYLEMHNSGYMKKELFGV